MQYIYRIVRNLIWRLTPQKIKNKQIPKKEDKPEEKRGMIRYGVKPANDGCCGGSCCKADERK